MSNDGEADLQDEVLQPKYLKFVRCLKSLVDQMIHDQDNFEEYYKILKSIAPPNNCSNTGTWGVFLTRILTYLDQRENFYLYENLYIKIYREAKYDRLLQYFHPNGRTGVTAGQRTFSVRIDKTEMQKRLFRRYALDGVDYNQWIETAADCLDIFFLRLQGEYYNPQSPNAANAVNQETISQQIATRISTPFARFDPAEVRDFIGPLNTTTTAHANNLKIQYRSSKGAVVLHKMIGFEIFTLYMLENVDHGEKKRRQIFYQRHYEISTTDWRYLQKSYWFRKWFAENCHNRYESFRYMRLDGLEFFNSHLLTNLIPNPATIQTAIEEALIRIVFE